MNISADCTAQTEITYFPSGVTSIAVTPSWCANLDSRFIPQFWGESGPMNNFNQRLSSTHESFPFTCLPLEVLNYRLIRWFLWKLNPTDDHHFANHPNNPTTDTDLKLVTVHLTHSVTKEWWTIEQRFDGDSSHNANKAALQFFPIPRPPFGTRAFCDKEIYTHMNSHLVQDTHQIQRTDPA